MAIGEVCNREVVVIDKGASIREAVQCMRDEHVGDVIVTEGEGLNRVPVGILTDRDVVIEVLAEDVAADNLCVADIMSYELLVAREDDDILDTIKAMRAKGVRRVPVVNPAGRLAGIISVDDLIELISEQLSDLVTLFQRSLRHERGARP